MKKFFIANLSKVSNLFFLTLPLLYGCNSGGGGSGSAASGRFFTPEASADTGTALFSSVPDIGGTGIATLASVPDAGISASLATIHNPEPVTMLLLGGGMLAMGFINSRMRANKYS